MLTFEGEEECFLAVSICGWAAFMLPELTKIQYFAYGILGITFL